MVDDTIIKAVAHEGQGIPAGLNDMGPEPFLPIVLVSPQSVARVVGVIDVVVHQTHTTAPCHAARSLSNHFADLIDAEGRESVLLVV